MNSTVCFWFCFGFGFGIGCVCKYVVLFDDSLVGFGGCFIFFLVLGVLYWVFEKVKFGWLVRRGKDLEGLREKEEYDKNIFKVKTCFK